MELRQLRYLVRTVELGSMSQAAFDLGVAQSAVSNQIQRLEGELATRLLQRTAAGVVPTEAGIAFVSHARLVLRHVDEAMLAAKHSRLSGTVGVGLAPTTASVAGVALMQAMRAQFPDIRLHLVEGMSGHLGHMLNAREIDLAILFDAEPARRWTVHPLHDERLFFICSATDGLAPLPTTLERIADLPLVLPTPRHGLRRVLDAAFTRHNLVANIVAEVDSLAVVMDMVAAGLAATLQPWAALARQPARGEHLRWAEIADPSILRRNWLCSLSEDELSPAAMATRGVLRQVIAQLRECGSWKGTAPCHLATR